MSNRERDLDIMTRTILGEAGGEDAYGQAAVGSVIFNRSKDSRWGGSVADVSLAPNQFSTWNTYEGGGGNDPNKWDVNSPEYKRTRRIAEGVLDGTIEDKTGGATHYYSPKGMVALDQGYTTPKWFEAETQTRGADPYEYGGHIFTGKADVPVVSKSTKGEPEAPQVNPYLPTVAAPVNPYLPVETTPILQSVPTPPPILETPIAQKVVTPVADPKKPASKGATYEAEVEASKKAQKLREAASIAENYAAGLAANRQGNIDRANQGTGGVPRRPLPENGVLQTQGPGPTGSINQELYDMGAIGRRYVGTTPDYYTDDQLAAQGAELPPALSQNKVGALNSGYAYVAGRPPVGPQGAPVAPGPQAPGGPAPMPLDQFGKMVNFAVDKVDPPKEDWYFDGGSGSGSGGSGGQGGGATVSTQGSPSTAPSGAPADDGRWLNADRGQMLLGIGAGLLSGNDWASGIAGASENLMGVNQTIADRNNALAEEQRQRQYQLEDQRTNNDQRMAEIEARRSEGNPLPIRMMEMADGSTLGVIQDGTTFRTPDGTDVSKSVVRPVNNSDGYGSKGQMGWKQATEERTYLNNTAQTLRSFDRVTETMQDQTLGLPGVVQNTKAFINTLLGRDLTMDQINKAVATGDMQGLIGQTREQTVGPGVMTEQDAFRVLQALGGDINVLSTNPQVIVERLKVMREGIMPDYTNRMDAWNTHRTQYPNLDYGTVEPYAPGDPGALASGNQTPTSGGIPKPAEIEQSVWDQMPEEDRKLFQ